MKNHLIKFALILVPIIWMSSCSKNDNAALTASETTFNTDVLNKNFFVESAIDNGTDITTHFNNYTFKYSKSSTASGTVTASNDLLNFNGNWAATNDFSNLTITFSNAPEDFNFVNNGWKITAMTDTYFHLTAANGDNKTLNFAVK